MKNIFFLLLMVFVVLSFNSCCGCDDITPVIPKKLNIELRTIKDPIVKSIKVKLQNLDGIKPKFTIYTKPDLPEYLIDYSTRVVTIKREQYVSNIASKDEKTCYFKDVNFHFEMLDEPQRRDEKRTYELKMYVNDKLFFRKILSFTITRIDDFFDAEYDNMEYVKGEDIKITDADIKKWFEK